MSETTTEEQAYVQEVVERYMRRCDDIWYEDVLDVIARRFDLDDAAAEQLAIRYL